MLCFFFNDTATTEIYTLSLHDALPISVAVALVAAGCGMFLGSHPLFGAKPPAAGQNQAAVTPQQRDESRRLLAQTIRAIEDRKSTRLNSSHANISYAVFCLQKKKNTYT